MELKEKTKYKQTELGLIPNDWLVVTLGEIGNFKNGINKSTEDFGFGSPFVNLMDVFGKSSISSNNDFGLINTNDAEKKLYNLISGDVLFIRSSVKPSGVGLTSLIERDLPDTVFSGFIIRFRDNGFLTKEFKKHCFYNEKFRNNLIGNSTVSANTNINQEALKKLLIAVPSDKMEQKAIATALSDTDNLINSLEKLIAKKKAIKQGVMQRLFKPKKGWEVKTLGMLGKVYGGLSGKSKQDFSNGQFPYIPFMNVMSNPKIDIQYFGYVNINTGEVQNKAQKGDLFFNGSSETPEELGMCSVLLHDIPNLYLNSFCFGYRLNSEFKTDGLYLSYFFRSSEGRKLFYSMAQGATRYNLSKANFNKLEILMPKPDEQIKISKTLSDMDSEIFALETKLGKCKQIKQGMMQNLLTGKIRLV